MGDYIARKHVRKGKRVGKKRVMRGTRDKLAFTRGLGFLGDMKKIKSVGDADRIFLKHFKRPSKKVLGAARLIGSARGKIENAKKKKELLNRVKYFRNVMSDRTIRGGLHREFVNPSTAFLSLKYLKKGIFSSLRDKRRTNFKSRFNIQDVNKTIATQRPDADKMFFLFDNKQRKGIG